MTRTTKEQFIDFAGDEPEKAAQDGLAMLYLQLTDAMGYDSGEGGLEFSPEEWAEALLKDAQRYRWLREGHMEFGWQGLPRGTSRWHVDFTPAQADQWIDELRSAHPFAASTSSETTP